jgi:tetratricopeptide (TPR) repeat protein
MPAAAPWIALLVLTVNLLAAGGITFAGIAPSWWLLLAVAVNSSEAADSGRRAPRIVVGTLAVGALALFAVCFLTLYQPVLRCRAKLDEGLARLRVSRMSEAEAAFREAAEADPYSAEPWLSLASLYHGEALASNTNETLSRFEAAAGESLRRNPHAHTLRKEVGDWRLALFARRGDRRQWDEAIKSYLEAVRLYPNHAFGHAQLAWAYHAGGDQQAARREATEALRLDALNPHREKKLLQQRLYDPTGKSVEPLESAEQTMQRLRK